MGDLSGDVADPGGSRGLLTFRGSSFHTELLATLIPQKPEEQGGSLTPKAKIIPSRHAEAQFLYVFTKMFSRVSPLSRSNASRLPTVIGPCVRIGNIPSCINQDLSREEGLPQGALEENLM